MGSAATVFHNTLALRTAAAWVAHTQEVLDATGQVLNALLQAESSERRYVITGEEAYLRFRVDAAALRQELTRLRALTADNAAQQKRLAELATLSERRIGLLQQGIQLQRNGDHEAARAIIVAGDGQALMDQIRQLVADIRAEENRLLSLRKRVVAWRYDLTRAMIVAGAALGLLVVWLFASVMRRHLAAQAKATAVLHEQRE